MPKTTTQDKIAALENIQVLIREFMEVSAHYEKASVVTEMNRIYKQLEKRKQRLINPHVRKPRKPKAEHVGSEAATGKIERWGRDGRKDKS